ncbi:EAL domain, c-di-GMP-specific phosphodiesterase class I (or its enzymatically inactive variant) [Methylophilus rhizosphaerae]|uniref:EAL domain, c-di-GMP-specific phosphodiesterase class I (Or its enzymatically inactive variant) n=1 Tax=Methylophilus rhizosphaerae TaxID=492660 RepID=A0A1G9BCA5_9PROT|nr:EAL domain-containing protein [Methylophilus rhizosphaerae]SDK37192.1 EAL domain, c-di-GMP-specific phosphodiesterase class I (or its enzymatically inactive variant) [Methylophilus rhizosphaerae]
MSQARVGEQAAPLNEHIAQRQFMRHRLVRKVQDNTHYLAMAGMVCGLLGFPHYLLDVDNTVWLAQLLTYLTFILVSYNLLLENGHTNLAMLTMSLVTVSLFVVQLSPYAADFNDTAHLLQISSGQTHHFSRVLEHAAGALLACLIATSYLFQRSGWLATSQAILYVAVMIPLIPLLGFFCGVAQPYGIMSPLTTLSGLLCAFSLLAKHASHPPMSYLLIMDDNGKQIRFSIVFLSFFAILLARAGVEFGDNMLRALPVVVVISILAIIYTMTATYYRKGQTSEQVVLPAADMDFASQVETALEQHQFFLVYQPQLDFNSGRLKGVEALIRWRHPEKGIISPDKFIRVAELTGLIVPLGKWVMRTACAQAAQWRDDPVLGQMEVSVNVSALQLKSGTLVEDILHVLEETGLPPHRLVIELTESAFVQDDGHNASMMHRLKEAGVKLAIDDFGTGYSCLSYLRDIPGDYLKVDRSFVMELPGHNKAGAVIQAIVSLGKSLDYRIIAEGIENEAQASFLKQLGCDIAQGFLFAKPLEADALQRWVAEQQQPLSIKSSAA